MFRIGEFSKIAQVSGRLLRYYDEIGLLSPQFIDAQTGYRYYSAQQLPRLNRILVLKELGLSLDQVARLVDENTSVEEIRGMLILRQAQIEQSVKEEMMRLRTVSARLEQIELHGQILEPDVILKSIPAQQFLALREVLPGVAARRRLVQSIGALAEKAVNSQNLGYIAIVTHSPVYDPEALDLEIGYLVTGKAPESLRLSEERTLTLRELPAIDTMATFVYKGHVSNLQHGHAILATWLEQENWQIVGKGREILIQPPASTTDEEVLVEIQFPVSKTNFN